jgi:hypothetical protein
MTLFRRGNSAIFCNLPLGWRHPKRIADAV